MGFLQNLLNGSSDLIEWQNAVMSHKSEKLYTNRKQLEAATIQIVRDCMRIFDDSVNLIRSTYKPDVFFSRLELAEQKLEILVYIEPYMKQVKAITMSQSMQELMNEFQSNKDRYICDFLYKCYYKTKEKADDMKTEKGKQNQFKKFQESIEPFADRLNKLNKDYFDAMCNQKI